jgi:hypothetical protein
MSLLIRASRSSPAQSTALGEVRIKVQGSRIGSYRFCLRKCSLVLFCQLQEYCPKPLLFFPGVFAGATKENVQIP